MINLKFTEEEIISYLKKINETFNQDEIDFELFSRLIAIILEENNNLQRKQDSEIEKFENEKEELEDSPLEVYDDN